MGKNILGSIVIIISIDHGNTCILWWCVSEISLLLFLPITMKTGGSGLACLESPAVLLSSLQSPLEY